MYALNANGLVNSAKLHHIDSAITAWNPHAFTLSESKTNTKTGPNLPNGDYNIFEEPGVQADNHHLYKWGVALGICKNIQIAQRVQVTAAALQGLVVAVDIVLQANNSSSFTHRVISAYAPWDPSTPALHDFWPELTKLCKSTSTSWTLGGDLNATVSSSECSSGWIKAHTQYLKFLDSVDSQDFWYNSPDRNLPHDWTSHAGPDVATGNIIDRIASSKQSYVDSEIRVADRPQDFVLYTNHRAVTANIVYTNPSGTGRSTSGHTDDTQHQHPQPIARCSSRIQPTLPRLPRLPLARPNLPSVRHPPEMPAASQFIRGTHQRNQTLQRGG
ncbi:hypothetical protein B0H14DRAFT_2585652 [Mycena olivaceomarginata]|nr:hypothetical protein B0H14DRAFT_2585652 [Mycena olivaceomarginata]